MNSTICEICYLEIDSDIYNDHKEECIKFQLNALNDFYTVCEYCFECIDTDNYNEHKDICLKLKSDLNKTDVCEFCLKNIDADILDKHKNECLKLQTEELMHLEFIKVDLTKYQKEALKYCDDEAKKYSETAYPLLLNRLNKLSITEDDLNMMYNYIINIAPVLIHINLNNILEHLCNDIYYRNQFQVSMSGGILSYALRIEWEKNLFNNAYGDVDGFYRVKYGPLNFTNDPNGVKSCYPYGNSYLLLNNNVKQRTTFCYGDSGGFITGIATFRHFYHIINNLDDNGLKNLNLLANGETTSVDSNYGFYIECQYHGDINLERDVDAIVVNQEHKNDKKIQELLVKFCDRHGCDLIFM